METPKRNKLFGDLDKSHIALILFSIIMVISLFTGVPKLIGTTMTLWLINVGYNVHKMIKGANMTVSKMIETNYGKAERFTKEGRPVVGTIFGIAVPMIFIGLIIVGAILYTFFFLL